MIRRRTLTFIAAISMLSGVPAASASVDFVDFISSRCILPYMAGGKPLHKGLTELTGVKASVALGDIGAGRAFVVEDGQIGNPTLIIQNGRGLPICVAIHRGFDRRAFGRAFDSFAQGQGITEITGSEPAWDGETEVRVYTIKRGARELMCVAVNYPYLKSTSVKLMTAEAFMAMGTN